MIRKRFLLTGIGLMLVATGAALALAGPLSRTPELHGTLLHPPLPAAGFELATSGGETVGPQDFRGQLVVLFFGFTNCPDVCPLTMHHLSVAMEALGNRADQVQVVLVSVDPERDPPERVDGYAKRFHPAFVGVTGGDAELREITSAYGIFYARTELDGEAGYTIDHSASTLVLDRNGDLLMIWPFDTPGEAMAADLRYLLRR
jgi:protein SCO1